jgi:hypothetical protein
MDIPLELVEAQNAVQWQLLALPGVTGVGIGFLERNGELLDEVALRVMVEDLAQIPAGIPETLAGFNVCLVEADIQPCGLPDAARYSEIAGGIKIGTVRGSGTLGAVAKDAAGTSLLGLTCFHVISNPSSTPDAVWQPDAPAIMIAGVPLPEADKLGDTLRVEFPRTPPLPFALERVSNVDGAAFSLDTGISTGRTVSPRIVGHNGGPSTLLPRLAATAQAEPGARVAKRGFVTGQTTGFIVGVNTTCRWTPGGQNTYLVEQYEIRSGSENPGLMFCDEGDSGAVIFLEGTQTAIGLLYGRSPSGTTAIANHIGNVERQLGITIVWS